MAHEAILDEVEHLYGVGARLEGLADGHPHIAEGLISIAGNVRSAATLLEVLVATKGDGEGRSKIQ